MSKFKKSVDMGQLNIFELIDEVSKKQKEAASHPSTAGKASIDAAIRSMISQALKRSPLSRYQVAARMSEILGVEISKAQIDAWSAESKENHRFPLVYTAAFCKAAEDTSLIRYVAELCGGWYIEGEDAVDLTLGKIEGQIKELQKQRRVVMDLRRNSR